MGFFGVRTNLEHMPVHDRPPRILNHFLPVLQLQRLAVVAQEHLADRVGRADAVIVGHDELQVHPLDSHARPQRVPKFVVFKRGGPESSPRSIQTHPESVYKRRIF